MTDIAPNTPENICSKCRLPFGHVGSFTYWIFKEGRCQCDDPAKAFLDGNSRPSGLDGNPKSGDINNASKKTLNNRYELIECVGRGAMGYVYKGMDQETGKVVALKLMRPELSRNELAVKRLMREVAVVSSLKNSHLGEVHGYGQEKDGLPYLVMEFVEGENLASVLSREKKLKQNRALNIFIQLCSGLMCAHLNGIIHRDIKPSNVIIQTRNDGHERATIVDFGFAGLLHEGTNSVRLTQDGEAFGSPAYMSPEQCLGEDLDVRSDIYSLGCLMYEVLTGVSPLVGENVLSTVAKQVRETPQSMRSHDSTIPPEMDELVLKCLQKEPLLRYQSASDLRIDLERIKNGEYVNAQRKGYKPVRSDKAGESKTLRGAEDGFSKTASLISIVLLAAVALGGLTGGAVWMFMQSQVKPDQPVLKSSPVQPVANKDVSLKKKLPEAIPAHANSLTQDDLAKSSSSSNKNIVRHSNRPHRMKGTTRAHSLLNAVSPSSSWSTLKELRVHK